jgi:NADPH:quinone reductase-like Zn-dependent oxidoreductase
MTTMTASGEAATTGMRGDRMKALVQEGYGTADVLQLREVDRPRLIEGRVLVRVRAASVNALDWHSVHGGWFMRAAATLMRQKDEPVRGVDLAGVVEAVGPGVTRFAVGDEVFGGSIATFAEYARARADRVVRKPRSMSFEEAACFGVAGRTALQGLRDIGELRAGQRVLVCGAGGGVGTFAVQIAKALGAHVTATTGTRNVDVVGALGADVVIDHDREDFTRRPERFDLVFDVAAHRPLGALRRVLVPGGVLVLCGASKSGSAAIFARIGSAWLRRRLFGQRIRFFVAKSDPGDLETLAAMYEERKLRPAIDRTYPLAEAREAVRYVGTGGRARRLS